MDMEDDRDDNPLIFRHHRDSYNMNSKIMLTAIISLSTIVVLVTVLHIYARWLLRRRRHQAAIHQLDVVTTTQQVIEAVAPKSGLDSASIASIPVLVFRQMDGQNGQKGTFKECSVCISMFEDGEMIRVLPNCKHAFHVECIDKWLGSTSTCPICRTEVRPRAMRPEARESMVLSLVALPSAPPLEGTLDGLVKAQTSAPPLEETSDGPTNPSAKVNGTGSCSRVSSFRRMLNRDRSSQRIHSRQQDFIEDVERE